MNCLLIPFLSIVNNIKKRLLLFQNHRNKEQLTSKIINDKINGLMCLK